MKTGIFRIFIFLIAYTCVYPVLAQKKGKFTVVIDAGHGGKDTGAIDNGVREKDINIGVATQLAYMIEKKLKGVNVVMTRNNDTFISLQERADIANRNHADLFISIHTNSVDAKNPNRKTVAGSTVYALGLHKDENNLKVARRENSVIELEKDFKEKYSGFDPGKDESYIIFEMAQKKTLARSLKFADLAQKQLVGRADRKDRGVKQAGFWVLWATSMPAVLVELDFICNPTSAKYMDSAEGQRKMAEALFKAVEAYVTNYKAISVQSGKVTDKSTSIVSADNSNKQGKSMTRSTAKPTPEDKVDEKADRGKSPDQGRTHVLSSVDRKARTDIPPQKTPDPRTRPAVRRRRSDVAKRASEKRTVETAHIPLYDERAYLAVTDEPVKVEPTPKTVTKPETPADRKKRLKEEKKKAEEEKKRLKAEKRLAEAKAKAKSNRTNSKGLTTIVVKSANANQKALADTDKETVKTESVTKKRTSLSGRRHKEDSQKIGS